MSFRISSASTQSARLRLTARSMLATSLETIEQITSDTLVALAAFVGKARLIDNVTITFRGDIACPDLGVLTASSASTEDL